MVMTLWLQNIFVFAVVGACACAVFWQGARTLYGKKSKLGSCCSRGCAEEKPEKVETQKVHFVPVELLSKRK